MTNDACDAWDQDALNRKPTGDFLYKLASQRFASYHSKPGQGALCIALDADWGAGKSFFVYRWSKDVEQLGHPVIRFDAWVNDLADDPLLGFLAEVQATLKPWIAELPVAGRVKRNAQDKFKAVMKAAPKAVLPAAAVFVKGALKKVAAVDFEELAAAVAEPQNLMSADGLKEISEAGLAKFFESALKSHTDKQAAIAKLKATLEDLFTYLGTQPGAQLPIFVFIDELDRCRPDYAIRLLEGIKHLFDAQGVCFVFSTNLTQLAEAAKAIYGSGFDGYRYLKRFFSFDYRLPDPDSASFAAMLAQDSPLVDRRLQLVSGLPENSSPEDSNPAKLLARAFSAISTSYRLDLRVQKQAFRLAEAAATGLPSGSDFHCLYMFFLAAEYCRESKQFDTLAPILPLSQIRSDLEPVSFSVTRYTDGRRTDANIELKEILRHYHAAAPTLRSAISTRVANSSNDYPDSLLWFLAQEGNGKPQHRDARTSIFEYHHLIRTAGRVRAQ